MESVKDRFLRYVKIDTQSEQHASKIPSTDKQLDLCRLLQGELAGSGKPGVPCADNDPVNIQVTLQRGSWLARACQGTPSVGAIIIGQIRDTARHLCHLLAPNTAERGRNCKQQ